MACPSHCACERCEHAERADLIALCEGRPTRFLRPVEITADRAVLRFIDKLRGLGFAFRGIDPVDRPVFSHRVYGELRFQREASAKTWEAAFERRREVLTERLAA